MLRKVLTILSVIVIFPGLLFGSEIHGKAGTTGMAFLKIGAGARGAGLGNAYTPVRGGGTSSWWNPAAAAGLTGLDVVLSHTEWLQGIRYEYIGVASGRGGTTLSLSLAGSLADDLERREGPSLEPIGTFGVYDLSLAASYSRSINRFLDAGISLKLLYERIDIESASGAALDAGLLLKMPIRNLNVGLSVRNIGKTSNMRDKPISLPRECRIGISYLFGLPAGRALSTIDFVFPSDYWNSINFGFEYNLRRTLCIRAGYQTGSEERNISLGFGVRWRSWHINYAFIPYYFELGNTHRVSLEFRTI